MRVVLWFATMLFFVAFFTYGYFLWQRSKRRRESRSRDE
jgi:preprotein translocase subunit YajC